MNELSQWLIANTPLDPSGFSFVELFAQERMRLLGDPTMAHYVERLRRDPRESMILHHHVSPPETWLFRYGASFEVLRGELFKHDRSHMIQVASLGCATGSEPFSIAATALSCGLGSKDIRILAMDYSPQHLAATKNGLANTLAQRAPIPSWASPWLKPNSNGQLELDAQGKDMIQAVRADVSTWTPEISFDFVFCRNVAIYLNDAVRRRLGKLLRDITNPRGILFIGHADSALVDGTDFRPHEVDHTFAHIRQEKSAQGTSPSAKGRSRTEPVSPGARVISSNPTSTASPVARDKNPATGQPQPSMSSTGLESAKNGLNRAQLAADSGNIPEAQRELLAYLAVEPTDIQGHLLHGCVQLAQNNFTEAERSFTKVVYLDPSNALSLLSLAELAARRGDPSSAERFRDRAARAALEK